MSEHQLRDRQQQGANRQNARPQSESLARAEARAREIREMQKSRGGHDIMQLPASMAPEGYEYQLKRVSIFNQEDRQNINAMNFGGWTKVPDDRHPGVYIPPDMILVEKPKILVEEEREQHRRNADQKVAAQRGKLYGGDEGIRVPGLPMSVDKGDPVPYARSRGQLSVEND